MTNQTHRNSSDTQTIACNLTVFKPGELEAHIAEAVRLRKNVIGFEQPPEGFRIFFDSATNPDDVLAFARDEQRCCGFLLDATVMRETAPAGERIVLSVKASPEGAAAWVGSFYALAEPGGLLPGGNRKSPAAGWQASAVAARLCLSCLLPLVGGLLVARGLIPPTWNPGEGVYLATGAAILVGWFGSKIYRQARTAPAREEKKSRICGC